MDKEILMIIAMGSGGILFAFGGYKWKWTRRFLLPAIFGGLALFGGFELWRCGAMTLGLMVAFCLPYGERTPWWLKAAVGISYVLPTFFLGFTIWQIIAPILFIGLFKLSQVKWWKSQVLWKIWEFITGAMVGIIVAQLISG